MTKGEFSSYSIASSVISGIGGVMGARGQGKAARANIAAKSKAIGESIEKEKTNYIAKLESSYAQQEAIDRQLGDALSLRGIEAMKAEARLRAAGASTGLSGASIEEVSAQAGYDELFDQQVLVSRARTSKDELAQQRVADFLNFRTSTQNLAGQMQGNLTSVPSFLGAITSGLGSGLNTYMQYESIFGVTDRYKDMNNQYSSRVNEQNYFGRSYTSDQWGGV
jgi:hypothetical protein